MESARRTKKQRAHVGHSSSKHSNDPTQQPAIELLVLQSTPFCNLDCDYCYLPMRNDKRRLSMENLSVLLEKIVASNRVGEELTVLWHAGEPLVLPPEYYRQAFDLCRTGIPPSVSIRHCFQTNAVLITGEWCNFFRENSVRVGVSIDGPASIHDQHRKTRRGKGSHVAVMQGMEMLRSHGIDFYVITVLTNAALDYPEELFDFYRSNDIRHVSFNVEEVEGAHQRSSLNGKPQEDRYRRFLERFFQLMIAQPGKVYLRETERAARAILGSRTQSRPNQQARPYGIVTVDCQGLVSTYSPELIGQSCLDYDDFIFADLRKQCLSDIEASPAFRKMRDEVNEGLKLCQSQCDYYSVCGGGAPANKFYENGTFNSSETLYCRLGTQVPVDTVLKELERRADAGKPVPAWLIGEKIPDAGLLPPTPETSPEYKTGTPE